MPSHAIILRQMLLVQRLQRGPGQRVPFAELRRYLLTHGSIGGLLPDYSRRTRNRGWGWESAKQEKQTRKTARYR